MPSQARRWTRQQLPARSAVTLRAESRRHPFESGSLCFYDLFPSRFISKWLLFACNRLGNSSRTVTRQPTAECLGERYFTQLSSPCREAPAVGGVCSSPADAWGCLSTDWLSALPARGRFYQRYCCGTSLKTDVGSHLSGSTRVRFTTSQPAAQQRRLLNSSFPGKGRQLLRHKEVSVG